MAYPPDIAKSANFGVPNHEKTSFSCCTAFVSTALLRPEIGYDCLSCEAKIPSPVV